VSVGQRVVYCTGPLGAYAERQLVPAQRLIPLPKGIGEAQAAGMMLKGMTAEYLLRRTYRVQPGETILFHVRFES
jgi:NADPH:quinone reductase